MILLIGAVAIVTALAWSISNSNQRPDSAADNGLNVPSGQVISIIDTVQTAPGPEGLTLRFRFLAPAIARQAGVVSAEAAQADMAYLCTYYALPRVPETGPSVQQIIISLADQVLPFGESDPEVTQFFEAFSFAGGNCIWEAF